MKDLIVIRQLPVIEDRLKDLSAEIDRQVEEAMELAVTPDTVKAVKVVRADLNKQFKELEEQRKAVKKAILEPYDKFDEIYRRYVSVRFSDADDELKRKINAVENQLKQEKEDDLRDYFRELADSEHLDWLEFERGGFNVTLSKSRTALHKEVEAFVGLVSSDTAAINVMPDAEEVFVEYKRTLRLGEAVETVSRRHKEIEQERREREHLAEMRKREEEASERVREAARENPVVSAPKKVGEQTVERLTLTFSVTDTRERLKLLKSFLDSNHYQYE